MIRTFEVHGNEYEMGFQIGCVFQQFLKDAIPKYERMLADPGLRSTVREVAAKLEVQYPRLLMEMNGRADGAGIPRDPAYLMFFTELHTPRNGCTTAILKKKNGHVLFCHNDDELTYHADNVALIKYNYGNFWIVSYTVADTLAGSAFSWNSAGMVFTSNFILTGKTDFSSISRFVMERDIINSRSMDEAKDKLLNCEVASPFSMSILECQSETVLNAEKDLKDLYITPISDRFARSNHFLAKPGPVPEPPAETLFRYQRTKELLAGLNAETADIADLIRILGDQSEYYNTSVFKDTDFYQRLNRCNMKSLEDIGFSLTGKHETVRIYDCSGNCLSEFGKMEILQSLFKVATVANFAFDSESRHIRIADYLGHDVLSIDYEGFMGNPAEKIISDTPSAIPSKT